MSRNYCFARNERNIPFTQIYSRQRLVKSRWFYFRYCDVIGCHRFSRRKTCRLWFEIRPLGVVNKTVVMSVIFHLIGWDGPLIGWDWLWLLWHRLYPRGRGRRGATASADSPRAFWGFWCIPYHLWSFSLLTSSAYLRSVCLARHLFRDNGDIRDPLILASDCVYLKKIN